MDLISWMHKSECNIVQNESGRLAYLYVQNWRCYNLSSFSCPWWLSLWGVWWKKAGNHKKCKALQWGFHRWIDYLIVSTIIVVVLPEMLKFHACLERHVIKPKLIKQNHIIYKWHDIYFRENILPPPLSDLERNPYQKGFSWITTSLHLTS